MSNKINKKYVPSSLSVADRKKQIKSIKEKTERPKLKSFQSKRSTWAEKFETKYGYKINQKAKRPNFSKGKRGLLFFRLSSQSNGYILGFSPFSLCYNGRGCKKGRF